jgi:CDP-diacylglycerol--serine O-phosphatidyltransferase
MKKTNIIGRGKKKLRSSIYLFPSLFTIGSMYCAFASIAASVEGRLSSAAIYIGFSIILDGLDGRIARALNAHTEMGLQLDSLSDVIAFGVAPAILTYYWAFHPYYGNYYSKAGFLAAFLFLICSSLRLAKFNIISVKSDKKYFSGLPTPASAGTLAALVYYYPMPLKASNASLLAIALLVILSYLMISKIKYYSFKSLTLKKQKPYLFVIIIASTVALILTFSKVLLISIAFIYLVSGISIQIVELHRKHKATASLSFDKGK